MRVESKEVSAEPRFRFEKLDVWHKSIAYANQVYLSTESFPSRENYGLTSQLRRAAVSISANIAEGSSRISKKDYSRFIEIAYGSLCESVSLLRIALLQGFISSEQHDQLCEAADELARMLSSFRNKLEKWNQAAAK